MSTVLVIDVGTTSMRAAVVGDDGAIIEMSRVSTPPDVPAPGLVEFDAAALADQVVATASALIEAAGRVDAVGVTNQRASTVVWDAVTGQPVHPGLGWQDLRTIGECLSASAEHGLALAPNQSATKIAWILANMAGAAGTTGTAGAAGIAGAAGRRLRFGTIDSWLTWTLSRGDAHVTDHTNAAVTGLLTADASAWSAATADILGIPLDMLPGLVPSAGPIAAAAALPGSPPITALAGDQQASLVGQGCVRTGRAKITFGTGGMLDICTGPDAPATSRRSAHGTFPIVAWSHGSSVAWGIEAIMLSAGSNIDWLVDDLGLLESAAASAESAGTVATTDGVVYVPALMGLGTPRWDYGARGTLLGITRGTTAHHVVRAVLEGIAHRGADMVDAAEADTGLTIPTLRIDGGMSANAVFVQALADTTAKPVEVSPVVEATTVGAGFLAGLGAGIWTSIDDAESLYRPSAVIEPSRDGPAIGRDRWADAVDRAAGWFPELSALDF